MSSLPRPSWKLLTSLLLLSLVPVMAGVVRLAGLVTGAGGVTPENARFVAAPWPVALHIVCATVFCILGAFQLDSALRRRLPHLHRVAGRMAAPCGLIAALTGVWMTATYAIPESLQGPLLYAARMAAGLSMSLALVISVRAVRQGRIAQHSAWMLRAYALGQGAGTQVLLLLPVSLLAGAPTFLFRDVLMAAAWGLNLVVAEWIIRRRLPSH
jgi:uncharacterized membrane protein YozB (DUF420 family)